MNSGKHDKSRMEKLKQHSDSSIDRLLGLLDLFTPGQPVWTVDELVEHEGMARATVYRYIKALVDAGFLASIGGSSYALGPRFIEMDRHIRLADPLLQVAPTIMAELRDQVAGAQLLCRFYGQRVLTIHMDCSDERIIMSMERGRPFPLFLGAPSRAILANLPSHQLQRLFLYHGSEITAAGLGKSWMEFRDKMKAIRKAGYAVASDIDTSLIGISAPIFVAPRVVSASICMVRLRSEVKQKEHDYLAKIALDAASAITHRVQRLSLDHHG